MKRILLFTLVICQFNTALFAQCGGGKTRCNLNWDYLSFFPSAGLGTYTNLAQSQTQNFSFGTQKLTVTHNFTGSNARGENNSHTAFAGEDVNFAGNGTVTLTFQAGVDSIRFSIHDIDVSQRMTISSPGATVNMTTYSGSILTIGGNNTASANAKASNTSIGNTSNDATIDVLITRGTSMTSVTLAMTETAGSSDWWLGSIAACSPGLFTNNYFQVARPFTGQPGYVIASRQDTFYYVNPADGRAKFLFRDPGHLYMNSVAYDPVKHYVYYCHSLTGAAYTVNGNNKTLRRYSYDRDTLGIVMSDIEALVPTFEQGIESGAAAFYDGCLYLGLEANATGSYKSIIWRIEFDAADNPIAATQVFAIDGANHDWGDFGVADGTLVDFDARTGVENYYHSNLYSKAVTVYSPTGTNTPRQTAVDWNNNFYSIGGPTTLSPGTITLYNGNGTLNTGAQQTISDGVSTGLGSWGDAGEAFKPRADFGDAPASYDPIAADPAVHETSAGLYIGNAKDDEWTTRGQSAAANSDNFDDGILIGSIVNPSAGSFFAQVRYFNNTGSTATMCAWVDFNNNGLFDAGEGRTQTLLPSSASAQNVFFNWTGVSTSLTNGSYTYIRIRIASTAAGMTVANATGYFGIGEVEDYRLIVTTYPLVTQLLDFTVVKKDQNKAQVKWNVAEEEAGIIYTLQRSSNSQQWADVTSRATTVQRSSNDYDYTDEHPLKGTSYYRLKITGSNQSYYSTTRKLNFGSQFTMQVLPNPASATAFIQVTSETSGVAQIALYDVNGRKVHQSNAVLKAGDNSIPVSLSQFSNGYYWLHVATGADVIKQKLMVSK